MCRFLLLLSTRPEIKYACSEHYKYLQSCTAINKMFCKFTSRYPHITVEKNKDIINCRKIEWTFCVETKQKPTSKFTYFSLDIEDVYKIDTF